MNIRSIFIVVAGVVLLSACGLTGSSAPIDVREPWVRAAQQLGGVGEMQTQQKRDGQMAGQTGRNMAGTNTAAFMQIRNNGSEADMLVSAASDAAEVVEIHLSEMKDGVMTMRQVPGVELPAGSTTELKPGSYHIMLINITRDLNSGDTVELVLEFEKTGELTVQAEVHAP